MANPPNKPIESITKPISSFFNGQVGKIKRALMSALAASQLQGAGLAKVNDTLQDVATKMIGQITDDLGQEKALDNAIDDLVATTLIDDAVEKLTDQTKAEELADVLNEFGNNPIPPNTPAAVVAIEEPPVQTPPAEPETAPDAATVTPPTPPTEPEIPVQKPEDKNSAAVPRGEQPTQAPDRQAAGADQAAAKRSEQKNSEDANPTEPPVNPTGGESNVPVDRQEAGINEGQTDRDNQKNSDLAEADKPNPAPTESTAPNIAATEAPPETKPAEPAQKPVEEPTPPPEVKEVMTGLGEPLIETDENGLPRLKNNKALGIAGINNQSDQRSGAKSEEAPADQTEAEPDQNPDLATETTAQTDPSHGKIDNNVPVQNPNQPAIDELTKKLAELEQAETKVQKEIDAITHTIEPIESQIEKNNFRIKGLRLAWITLIVIAVLFAITIIFFFVVPIISGWAWPLKKGIDLLKVTNDELKDKIKSEVKKRDAKKAEKTKIIKQYNEMARERYKLTQPPNPAQAPAATNLTQPPAPNI